MKKIFVLVFLLVFSINAFSQILIGFEPIGKEVLYEGEKTSLDAIVFNSSQGELTNLNFKFSAENGLVFLENEKEKQELDWKIEKISGFQKESRRIEAKAIFASPNPRISALSKEKQVSGIFSLTVLKVPLLVETIVSKTIVAPGEEIIITEKLSNRSKSKVSGISSILVLPKGFDSNSVELSIPILEPNQSISGKSFFIVPSEEAFGQSNVALKTIFTDELGLHETEKSFNVIVIGQFSFLILLFSLIFAIIAIGFLLDVKKTGRKKEGKAEEKKEHKPKERRRIKRIEFKKKK